MTVLPGRRDEVPLTGPSDATQASADKACPQLRTLRAASIRCSGTVALSAILARAPQVTGGSVAAQGCRGEKSPYGRVHPAAQVSVRWI
jgi:hypothetical protein